MAQWWIDNAKYDTGLGPAGETATPLGTYPVGYAESPSRPPSPVEQGFAVHVRMNDGREFTRRLDKTDFDAIGFIGEYPIAEILYQTNTQPTLPVEIRGEVFSPWIPLNARDSANPATILRYEVRNISDQPVDVALGGWLENFIWRGQTTNRNVLRRNRAERVKGMSGVVMDVVCPESAPLQDDPRLGEMSLVVLEDAASILPEFSSVSDMFTSCRAGGDSRSDHQTPLRETLIGAVVHTFPLAAGESKTVNFLITWYFPHRRLDVPNEYPENGTQVGNLYSLWYDGAWSVTDYLHEHFPRLIRETYLFRDTYFDTTLPYWFVQRINMPTSTLATETVHWWRNGRFWGWEGVGTCLGTCGHVYNFAQAIARLFPELERSVRLMQDLGPVAFHEQTGRIDYRGGVSDSWQVTNNAWGYAADAQAGYVLKLYREHLLSKDSTFLGQVWPKVKKVIGYLIERDAAGRNSIERRADLSNADGVIEDAQHTTWDSNLYGPNGYVGTWYLAALRAAEEMAVLQGEAASAEQYRTLYENGRKFILENLWNGEYFIHAPSDPLPEDATLTPSIEYGNGCLSNQLAAQTFAMQLGLGEMFPHEHILATLQSIYHYNWTSDVGYDKHYPDIGPRHRAYPTIRKFAFPGEAGLFECTWPHSQPPAIPVLHNAEVFTGTEYQAAALMLQEGMIQEGLTLLRAVHDRYDGTKRNPWNEIECGDHYARAMAAWGCLLGASGFVYDGPAGKIGCAPRMSPDEFKCFFSACEAWGSLAQQRREKKQINQFEVKWGTLRIRQVVLELPEGKTPSRVHVSPETDSRQFHYEQQGLQLHIFLHDEQVVNAEQFLRVEIEY